MAASAAATKPSITNASVPSPSPPATAMAPRQKVSASPRPKSQADAKLAASLPESSSSAKHAHDRILFLMANFVGCMANITVKNGDQFSGIFSGASLDSPDSQYVLKMSKRIAPAPPAPQQNGVADPSDDYTGYGDDHVMTFDVKDVVNLNVPNVATGGLQPKLTNGSSFRTDTDISGNLAIRERELQRWEPSAEANMDLSMNGSGGGNWDQFEANERLYGVRTDYDENIYTTSIDRSHPTYKQRAAEAERLAREIESSATANAHVAEERNLKSPEADGMDEEERFSGVKRDFPPLVSSQANKYTPPARRPPTGQPTVPGAPVDPAIISSQLAQPEASKSSKGPIIALTAQMKENTDPSTSVPPDGLAGVSQTEDLVQAGNERDAAQALKPLASSANVATSRAQATPSQPAPNATSNVEHQVADAFRTFAANEKLKMQEKQREKQKRTALKEREVRLNDLKKFSANFKLHTAVPEDILGILARDKAKQVEIVGKAQQDLEQRKAALAQNPQPPASESPESRSVTDGQVEPPTGPANPAADRLGPRGPRNGQVAQNFQGRKGERNVMPQNMTLPSTRVPGHLGERLLAQQQQQYRGRAFQGAPPPQIPPQDPRMQPIPSTAPAAINTDVAVPGHSGAPTPNSALSRFNAQASEFKPNPTATTFLPGGEESSASASPSRNRAQPAKSAVNRVSFFGDKKPQPADKKLIADGFNPIARMKKEVIEAGKTKDFAANGGIPQAYRTPPTWEPGKGNEEKSYVDMFEKSPIPPPSASPGSYAMAHQHQLPPHLQQGPHTSPQIQTPQQQYRMPPNGQPRDNYFDDHRMHPSSSQQSSVGPSPSFRPPMLAYPHQMGGPMQPQFVQGMGQFPMGLNGQPVNPIRQYSAGQFVNPQGGPMAAPMMATHSSNGQFMAFPMPGQMPMYSPGGHQVFPNQMSGPHTPGQGGYPSPRPGAPMMVHQGSQGHGGPPYMMPGPNQQGGPGAYGKQQPNQIPMRGGVPMMQQNSYGSSPHMPHHFPAQHRGGGPQYGGGGVNFGYQQMHPAQMMQFPHGQQHPPTGPMRRPSEQSDVK